MSDDVQALQYLVSRYHQAFTDKDRDAVLTCLASPAFSFIGNRSSDPTQWEAGGFVSEDERDKAFLGLSESSTPHANKIDFLHTDILNNLAIVVTRETGSNEENTWENATPATFLCFDNLYRLLSATIGEDQR